MSHKPEQDSQSSQGITYRIRIEGHLNPVWAEIFEGFVMTLETEGETHLIGKVIDQAALYGVLKRLRDLNVPLIEIKRLPDDS